MKLLKDLFSIDPISKALQSADELQKKHEENERELRQAIGGYQIARREAAKSYIKEPSAKHLSDWVLAASNALVLADTDFTDEAEQIRLQKVAADWVTLTHLVEPARLAAVQEIERQIDQIKTSIAASRDSVGLPEPTPEIIEAEPAIRILLRRKEVLDRSVRMQLAEGKIRAAISGIRGAIS